MSEKCPRKCLGKVDVVAAAGVEKLAREGGVPWALDTDTS